MTQIVNKIKLVERIQSFAVSRSFEEGHRGDVGDEEQEGQKLGIVWNSSSRNEQLKIDAGNKTKYKEKWFIIWNEILN